jgi:hypothetical protein
MARAEMLWKIYSELYLCSRELNEGITLTLPLLAANSSRHSFCTETACKWQAVSIIYIIGFVLVLQAVRNLSTQDRILVPGSRAARNTSVI